MAVPLIRSWHNNSGESAIIVAGRVGYCSELQGGHDQQRHRLDKDNVILMSVSATAKRSRYLTATEQATNPSKVQKSVSGDHSSFVSVHVVERESQEIQLDFKVCAYRQPA